MKKIITIKLEVNLDDNQLNSYIGDESMDKQLKNLFKMVLPPYMAKKCVIDIKFENE